jgi:hypothetical protein
MAGMAYAERQKTQTSRQVRQLNECSLQSEIRSLNMKTDARKAWLEANKEILKEKKRAYYQANKEKIKAKVKDYRDSNLDKCRETCRKYYANNSDRLKEQVTKYYFETKEERKEINKLRHIKYKEENKDKWLESKKKWRDNNKEKESLIGKRWREAHPEKCRAYVMNRIAAKMQRTPIWLTQEQKILIEQLYADAKRLEIETGVKHHVDHILPMRGKKVSGLHVPENLRIVTAKDNMTKSNRYEPA